MSWYQTLQSATHSVIDYSHTALNKSLGKEEAIADPLDKYGLDPMATVIFIATLRFREVGTKIQVNPSLLTPQEPTEYQYGINFMFAARSIRGDKQEDLKCIPEMIRKAAVIYKPHIYKQTFAIFQAAARGLEALAKTYEMDSKENSKGTANRIRMYWIETIKTACNVGIESHEGLEEIDLKFRSVWTEEALATVVDQLRAADELVKNNHPKIRNSYSHLVKDIDTLLLKKREQVKEIFVVEKMIKEMS